MDKQKGFSIDEAIKFGWQSFKTRPGFYIAFFVVAYLITLVPNALMSYFSGKGADGLAFVFLVVTWVVSLLVAIGMMRLSLNVADKKTASWNDLTAQANLFGKVLGASILYGLIVMAGTILLIIPGIIWAIKYSQFLFVILDEKDIGMMDSLKRSGEITQGAKGMLFVLAIVLVLLNLVGMLALLVGLLVTYPITYFAQAHVYRTLATQTPKSSAAQSA